MPPMNPVELPEIAELVATYLEGKDLATCVCVSKIWRDIFLRYRWRVVRIGILRPYSTSAPITIGPHRTDIYNHRHWIQDLSLVNMFAELDVCQYQNLRCLEIDMDGTGPPSNRVSMDPITMAPSLVDLKLNRVDFAPSFWETLSTHPHIKHLALSCTLKKDDTPGFWKTCMKLESLEIGRIHFEEEDGLPRNAVFDQMRSLKMWGISLTRGDPYQLNLVLQSPMLDSLDWEIGGLRGIEERIIDSRWPQLKKLRIRGFIADNELAFILNGVGNSHGRMEDLTLHYCDLEARVFDALGVHFSTLVKVNITCARLSKPFTSSDFLCFCPSLEIFQAKNVFAKEIAERGPWMCQRLRELEIYLCFQDYEQDLHQLIYERLSTLIRLERLTIQCPYEKTNGANEGLAFRLDCGLDRLASLQQLTYFCIRTRQKGQPGMEEVVWMVDNLRMLRRVAGNLNTDEVLRAQLVSVFESHGIVYNDW